MTERNLQGSITNLRVDADQDKFYTREELKAYNNVAPLFDLGTVLSDVDGNKYKYVKFSEASTIGQVHTQIEPAAWDSAVMDGGATAGDVSFDVDTKAAAVTEDQFAGYYIGEVPTDGYLGGLYKIKSHTAAAPTVSFVVTLVDALPVAIANSVALTIFHPNIVELIDADTELPAGAALGTVTVAYYGFLQVAGFIPIVSVGHSTSTAVVLNEPVICVAGVPGNMQGSTGTVTAEEAAVGVMIAKAASTADKTTFISVYMKSMV